MEINGNEGVVCSHGEEGRGEGGGERGREGMEIIPSLLFLVWEEKEK